MGDSSGSNNENNRELINNINQYSEEGMVEETRVDVNIKRRRTEGKSNLIMDVEIGFAIDHLDEHDISIKKNVIEAVPVDHVCL